MLSEEAAEGTTGADADAAALHMKAAMRQGRLEHPAVRPRATADADATAPRLKAPVIAEGLEPPAFDLE